MHKPNPMRILKPFSLLIICAAFAVSCEDDSTSYANNAEMSSFARNYLQMKLSPGMNLTAFQNNGSPSGFPSWSSFGRANAGRTNDSTATDSVDVPSPWTSCAIITETINPDKSVTITYDYGDGCEEGYEGYRYFIHGKYSYTYFSAVDSTGPIRKETFSYAFDSENYGGRFHNGSSVIAWASNGTSSSNGWYEYNRKTNTYRGENTYDSDNTYVYDGVNYVYKAASSSWYDHEQSVLAESESTTRNDENYYYSLVLEPLVTRTDCNPFAGGHQQAFYCYYIPVYVSGREFIKYVQDGVEGSFIINYGNGKCDSIVTIEEAGKVYQVNLANAESIFN
jgi:hypothetical protein